MTAKQPRGIMGVAVEYRLISLPMGEDLVTKKKGGIEPNRAF